MTAMSAGTRPFTARGIDRLILIAGLALVRWARLRADAQLHSHETQRRRVYEAHSRDAREHDAQASFARVR